MSWTRLDSGRCKVFTTWLHSSGWIVRHCGHPTAIWPYYLENRHRTSIVVSHNGRGFKSAKIGRTVVEGILAGRIEVTTKNCVRGIASTPRITTFGKEVV